MKYRNEQVIKADPGCTVDVFYGAGRFAANVFFERTLRNGDVQPFELKLSGLTPGELRCIARSLHSAIDSWATDWHKTEEALRGDE